MSFNPLVLGSTMSRRCVECIANPSREGHSALGGFLFPLGFHGFRHSDFDAGFASLWHVWDAQ